MGVLLDKILDDQEGKVAEAITELPPLIEVEITPRCYDCDDKLPPLPGTPPPFVDSSWSKANKNAAGDEASFYLWDTQTLRLKVEANPTTGYKWMVKPFESECIVNEGTDFVRNKVESEEKGGPMLMGVGGKTVLKFRAKSTGCTQKVQIAYARPWSFRGWNNNPAVKTIKFLVQGPPIIKLDPNVDYVELTSEFTTKKDGGYVLEFNAGRKLGLKLRQNSSTGYEYLFSQLGSSCIKKVGDIYTMDAEGYPKYGGMSLTGVGGTRTVIFEATGKAPCSETFQMANGRGRESSWDFEGQPGVKITLKVLPEIEWFKSGSSVKTIPAGKMGGLKLSENASTGYAWKIKEEDHSCVKLVNSKYEVKKQDTSKGQMMMAGVPGSRHMTFEVVGEAGCEDTYTMAYVQSWNFPGWDRMVVGKDADEFTFKAAGGTDGAKGVSGKNIVSLDLNKDKTVSKNTFEVNLSADKVLDISMEANRTTGYQWQMDSTKKCVTMINDDYNPRASEPGMVGVGGRRSMQFKVTGEAGCKETIRFFYTQPWTFTTFDKLDDAIVADQVINVDVLV